MRNKLGHSEVIWFLLQIYVLSFGDFVLDANNFGPNHDTQWIKDKFFWVDVPLHISEDD